MVLYTSDCSCTYVLSHLSPQYVGYFHTVVVHHTGQVVGGKAIRLEQDLVLNAAAADLNCSVHQILYNHCLITWHLRNSNRTSHYLSLTHFNLMVFEREDLHVATLEFSEFAFKNQFETIQKKF